VFREKLFILHSKLQHAIATNRMNIMSRYTAKLEVYPE
jgi:hypothetical protein